MFVICLNREYTIVETQQCADKGVELLIRYAETIAPR